MTSFKDMKKTKYLLSTVKQPLSTARKLSAYIDNGFNTIDLEFKNNIKFKNLPVGSAWMLINYYYWSKKLGAYSNSDLQALYEIGEYIYKRLREECNNWAAGMWGLQGTHGILYLTVRKFKPSHFIETGIAHGYSSYIILSAMKQNGYGKLTSIDDSKVFGLCEKEVPIGWIVPDTFRSNWNIIAGKTNKVLPGISEAFDAFMHDSGHTDENMTFEYNWAAAGLKQSGILISDDIDRNMAWRRFLSNNKNFKPILSTITTGVSQKYS